ncbi:MAG: hypothetical protein M1815_000307, partial [Lichina confinis]
GRAGLAAAPEIRIPDRTGPSLSDSRLPTSRLEHISAVIGGATTAAHSVPLGRLLLYEYAHDRRTEAWPTQSGREREREREREGERKSSHARAEQPAAATEWINDWRAAPAVDTRLVFITKRLRCQVWSTA